MGRNGRVLLLAGELATVTQGREISSEFRRLSVADNRLLQRFTMNLVIYDRLS